MCLSVPAKVISLSDTHAEVEVYSRRSHVYLACEHVHAGDWVLLYGGMAISVLDAETARETLELLARGSEKTL